MIPYIALMAAMPLPDVPEGGALPAEIHLLPAPKAGKIYTHDGRGPYTLKRSAEAIIAASFQRADKIEIDINHATYHAAPLGQRSDAFGWITSMNAREDGIWGTVEWTKEGAELVRGRAYRAISPALICDANEPTSVLSIGNASLVNRPNISGLTALHMETSMEGLSKIAAKLGLGAEATEAQILGKIAAMMDDKPAVALQSAMTEIGAALGVDGSNAAAVVTAVKVVKAGGADVVALQGQVTTLQSELSTLQTAGKRAASEAYIEAEMKKGRTGITAASREHLITLHMASPEQAVAIVEAQQIVTPASVIPAKAVPTLVDGKVALNSEQLAVASAVGITPEAFAKTLAEEAR